MMLTDPPSPSPHVDRRITFGGLDIVYDEDVLVPRPWTVAQARWAADLLPHLPAGPVLEVCCGVGHIGLAAVRGSGRRIVLVDAHPHACTLARRNLQASALEGEVREGDFADVLDGADQFVLVIADPPWVESTHVPAFPEDPVWAIDGGTDGLAIARGCVQVISRHAARPHGLGLLQLGSTDQLDALAPDLAAAGLTVLGTQDFPRGLLALLGHDRTQD